MAITPQEALDCFRSDDLIGIGMEADAVRRALHPENIVTYCVPGEVALEQPREHIEDDLSDGPGSNGHVLFEDWLELHRATHKAGAVSTASLTFGLRDTSEDFVRQLFAVRALQAETSGFTAFTLVPPVDSADLEPPTAVEYLRTLAIARIVLDNIPNIESRCVAHGLKVVQMALRFGANDAGPIADPQTAARASFTEEDLRRVIRDAGFTPVERDPLYRTLYLNN